MLDIRKQFKELTKYIEKNTDTLGTAQQYISSINLLINEMLRQRYGRNIGPKIILREELTKDKDELIDLINSVIKSRKQYYFKSAFKVLLSFLRLSGLYVRLNTVPKREVDKEKIYVSFETFKDIINSVSDDEFRLLAMAQYDVGQRKCDVLSLRYKQIYWDEEFGVIQKTLKKTKKEASLYLSSVTTQMLKDFIEKKFAGIEERDRMNRKVFSLSYKQYNERLKRITNNILGSPMSTQWIRHLRASHMARRGRSVIDIQNQLVCTQATALRYIQISGLDTKKLMKEDEPKW
jgi:integrase